MNNENKKFSVLCVVGARPNFMKMAPIMAAFAALEPEVEVKLVHTGQHYDVAMNHQYFQALGIPDPDINLEVGSGSHAVQTADVMKKFEPALDEVQPTATLRSVPSASDSMSANALLRVVTGT